MANAMKGEVDLLVGEKTYTLRYSFDVLCKLETKLGKGFPVMAQELADPEKLTLGLVREILHAGLEEFHKEVTLVEAGDLIGPAGGTIKVLGIVDKAMSAAMQGTEDKDTRPLKEAPKSSNGIGLAS